MICHVDIEIFHCMYKCKGVSVKIMCHVKHDLIALGWMANSYCRAHITCYKLNQSHICLNFYKEILSYMLISFPFNIICQKRCILGVIWPNDLILYILRRLGLPGN